MTHHKHIFRHLLNGTFDKFPVMPGEINGKLHYEEFIWWKKNHYCDEGEERYHQTDNETISRFSYGKEEIKFRPGDKNPLIQDDDSWLSKRNDTSAHKNFKLSY